MARFCAGFRRYMFAKAAIWSICSHALAANDIWDGNFPNITDNLWGTGANWVDNTTPGNSDIATFNGGATVGFNADPAAIQGLTVSAGNVTFASSGGARTLSVTSATGGRDALLNGGTLSLGSAGNPLNLEVGDNLTVQNGSVLNVNHGSDLDGFGSFGVTQLLVAATNGDGNGVVNIDGASSILTAILAQVGNTSAGNGTINVGVNVSGGTLRVQSSGTLTINATGTVNVGDADSTGTLNSSGSLVIDGGALNVSEGSTFDLFVVRSMSVRNGGRASFGGHHRLSQSSSYTISGGGSKLATLSGGLLEIIDDCQISVNLGGSILAEGGITVTQSTPFPAVLSIGGAGSTVNIAAGRALTLDGGDVNVTDGGALIVGSGGTTELRPLSSLNIDGGIAQIQMPLFNGGVINFLAGSLSYVGNLTVGSGGFLGSDLTLASNRALSLTGTTNVDASHTLILDGGTLNTGTLVVNGSFNFNSGTLGFITPGGAMNHSIASNTTNTTIDVNATNVSLGNAASFAGFNHLGTLNVGANSVTLNSAGYARLGVLTTLAGGTIAAPNGVVLPSGANFLGRGTINARVTGEAGSVIEANGALALGSAASPVGFNFGGDLRVRQHTVTLNSSAQALLGDLTTLGSGANPGTLNATNGAIVDFGNAVTGFGTISSTNTLAKRTFINGVAEGNSIAQPLTFTGYVKGVGTFNNVTFTGTFDPGLSTTVVNAGNLALSHTSTLIMELGGTTPGSGHDQIDSSGAIDFDGTLLVALANGFAPVPGSIFDLFNWATTSGTFETLTLPNLSAGLAWSTSQLYLSGVLSITTAGLTGDYNQNGTVNAADYAVWRDHLGQTFTLTNEDPTAATPGNVDAEDYASWKTHFGEFAGSGSVSLPFVAANAPSVPEPATLILTVYGLGLLWPLSRRG